VPAGTPIGTYSLFFDQNPQSIDPGGDFINLVSNANTVEVLPGTAISGAIIVWNPEPSSVVMMALGAIGLFGLGVRRSRRA
jgi:hypothetical protein